jgi:hypothetical protein
MLTLRIITVALMGAVVAMAAKRLLHEAFGHIKLTPRERIGEALEGIGAFAIGWGYLPGHEAALNQYLLIIGPWVFVLGAMAKTPRRPATPG